MTEYLVTMTTRVPDGTSEWAVQDIRTREAARSRELAAQGHLLRLWRPPLQPGDWRTLGLFAANDDAELEEILASMPLRVWRTDEVTPLSPHPSDPARQVQMLGTSASETGGGEFLTTFAKTVPASTAAETAEGTTQREADRARELAGQGCLERLWTLPGQGRALGLWQAPNSDAMNAMNASMPLYDWVSVHTTPLVSHPSDPALISH